ncbi:MAG: HAD family hydrolase, partial [Ruminococcaceae bacterium]|nr:HAD family hydrolase [Oscillospiraceae bacterium]
YIALNDEIKEDAEQAVRRLRRCGIKKTVMLSGDGEQRVRDVKEKLGIDECFFGLLPNGKTDNFSKIKESGAKVIFVGDGINDAPVLAMADVGIAMGALGSDAAIEAADVVLTDDRISALPEAVEISKRTMGIVWQNLIFSLSVKMLILILSAFGIANMWMAVFGDVGVSIIAVLNSLRAMRYKSRMEKTEK